MLREFPGVFNGFGKFFSRVLPTHHPASIGRVLTTFMMTSLFMVALSIDEHG